MDRGGRSPGFSIDSSRITGGEKVCHISVNKSYMVQIKKIKYSDHNLVLSITLKLTIYLIPYIDKITFCKNYINKKYTKRKKSEINSRLIQLTSLNNLEAMNNPKVYSQT